MTQPNVSGGFSFFLRVIAALTFALSPATRLAAAVPSEPVTASTNTLISATANSPIGASNNVAERAFASSIEEDLTSSGELSVTDLEWQDIEAQIDAGELNGPQQTLERRISELQVFGDRYDGQLVKPLKLLGRVYHKQKDYPRAAETFAKATQISRIANGLHSSEQLELVHREIASLKAMGNIAEANSRHEYAFSVASRHYGRFAAELVPELLKIGSWYTVTGDVIGARSRFADARMLLSANQSSAQSDMMILALRGLARSYRDERYPPFYSRQEKDTQELLDRNGLYERQQSMAGFSDQRLTVNAMHKGTEALLDVLRIQGNRLLAEQERLLANQQPTSTEQPTSPERPVADTEAQVANAEAEAEAEAIVTAGTRRRDGAVNLDAIEPALAAEHIDKTDFITAMLELADWYLLMDSEARAFAWYQQAYRIADTDPNSDADALFSQPKLLYFPRPKDPKLPAMLPVEAVEDGHVELRFDIDHEGRVKRLKTVQSVPKGLMDFRVRSSAKISRYRPRLIDGLPQPTMAHNFNHSFRYYPQDGETPQKVIRSDEPSSEASISPISPPTDPLGQPAPTGES